LSEAKKNIFTMKYMPPKPIPSELSQGIQLFLGTWLAPLSQLVGFEDPTNKKSCKNHWPTKNGGAPYLFTRRL